MRNLILFFLFCSIFSFSQEDRSNLFGFATSNTFTYCDVNDTSFVNKVIALQPKLLRFPGGGLLEISIILGKVDMDLIFLKLINFMMENFLKDLEVLKTQDIRKIRITTILMIL